MLRVISSLQLKRTLLVSASFAAALALIACGGSGGGPSPTTATTDGTTDGTTSGGGTLVTLTSDQEVSVAFQNGKGAWTPLSKGATGYSVKVTDPKGLYGFAVKKGDNLQIIHSTVAEDTTIDLKTPPVATKIPLTLTTVGIPNFDPFEIYGPEAGLRYGGSVTFNTQLGVYGTWDAVALLRDDPLAAKFVFKRNLDTSVSALTFDFSGPEAIGATSYPYPGGVETIGFVKTENGLLFHVPRRVSGSTAYLYFPSSLAPTDQTFATRTQTSTLSDGSERTSRTVAKSSTPDSPGEMPVLPALSEASAKAVDAAHGVYRFRFASSIDANYYRFTLNGTPTTQVYLTRGWLDGGSTYATPDLSALPGFASTIGPKTSAEIQAMVGHPSLTSFIAGSDYHRLPDLPTIAYGPGVVEASSTATKLPIK